MAHWIALWALDKGFRVQFTVESIGKQTFLDWFRSLLDNGPEYITLLWHSLSLYTHIIINIY